MMKTISIQEKFSRFSDHWHPRIIAELNGQYVKLAKVAGDFVWHSHAEEDELFLVFSGTLLMDFRDGSTQKIGPGEMIVVPRRVEHRPRTHEGQEVQLLLFEPISTQHTGEVIHDKTVKQLKWV